MSEHYPPPIVLDTTVLSYFAFTDDLDLLDAMDVRFVTVEAVVEELQTGVDHGHDFLAPAVTAVDVITVEGTPGAVLDDLDRGEAHALHAARECDGTIVTDDGPARDRADALDVPLTGSIGLLLRLVRQSKLDIDDADAIHRQWVDDGGFRSPVDSISEALDRLD